MQIRLNLIGPSWVLKSHHQALRGMTIIPHNGNMEDGFGFGPPTRQRTLCLAEPAPSLRNNEQILVSAPFCRHRSTDSRVEEKGSENRFFRSGRKGMSMVSQGGPRGI